MKKLVRLCQHGFKLEGLKCIKSEVLNSSTYHASKTDWWFVKYLKSPNSACEWNRSKSDYRVNQKYICDFYFIKNLCTFILPYVTYIYVHAFSHFYQLRCEICALIHLFYSRQHMSFLSFKIFFQNYFKYVM